MSTSNFKRNITVFCLYRFISRFYLYLPILAIILYNYKLSFLQIGFILAAHGLSIMIFKGPVNSITKGISSGKYIVFVGELFKSVGVLSLAISKGNIYILLVGQVLSGIGFALTSGTESGLLLSVMKAENLMSDYRKYEAKSQGIGFISILISGVVGSVIANIDNTLALYLTAPFSFIASIVILFFKQPKIEKSNNISAKSTNKANVKSSISSVLNLLIYYAFNRAIIMAIFVYLLPMFILKAFSIELSFFGAILGLFSLTANLIGTNFEKVSSIFKKSQLWIIVPGALFCAVLLMTLQIKYLLLVIPIFLGIASSIVRPLAMGKVNSIIKENNNLVMAKAEQVYGLFNAGFLIIIGVLFNYVSLSEVLYIVLGLLVLVDILLIVLFKSYRNKRTLNENNLKM